MIRKSYFHLHEYFTDYEIPNITEYIRSVLIPKSKNSRLLGVLEDDGVSESVISLVDVSHVVTDIDIIGTVVVCEFKLLETPSGEIAKGFVENDLHIYLAPRILKIRSGKILNLFLDLAIGDKGVFRQYQIDSLLGE